MQLLYSCKPDFKKRLVSSIFIGTLFNSIFYLFIRFNLFVLNIKVSSKIHLIIITSLFLVLFGITAIILIKTKHTNYLFYQDHIEIDSKLIQIKDIKHIKAKTKMFDRFFQTGSVQINQSEMEDIKQPQNIEQYLMNLTKSYQYYATYQNG